MGSSDFYIDYNIDVSEVGDEFKRETEQRLRELASSHSDMIGAAVSLEKTADTQTYDLYRVRIVAYKRPQDIVDAERSSRCAGKASSRLTRKTCTERYPSRHTNRNRFLRFNRRRNLCHLRQRLAARRSSGNGSHGHCPSSDARTGSHTRRGRFCSRSDHPRCGKTG